MMNPNPLGLYGSYEAAQRALAEPDPPDEAPAAYDDDNTYESANIEAIRVENVSAITAAEEKCKASEQQAKASQAKADAADGDVKMAQAAFEAAQADRQRVTKGTTPQELVERDRLVDAARDCLQAATDHAKPLRGAATADREAHEANVSERGELYAVRDGVIPMLVVEMRRQRRWQKLMAENDKDQNEIAALAAKHDLYAPAVFIKHGLRFPSQSKVRKGGPAAAPKFLAAGPIGQILAEHSWSQRDLGPNAPPSRAFSPPDCDLKDFTDDDKSLLACALARGTEIAHWGNFDRMLAPPTAHELAELAGMPAPDVQKEPPTHFAHNPQLLGRLKYALNPGGPIARRWADGMKKGPLSLEEGRRARGIGTHLPPARHVGGREALNASMPPAPAELLQQARDLEPKIALAHDRGDAAEEKKLTEQMFALRAQAKKP